MGAIRSIGTAVTRIGIAAAFAGLGVLGLALLGLAFGFSASLLERIIVLILGLGGLAIGAGYFRLILHRPETTS